MNSARDNTSHKDPNHMCTVFPMGKLFRAALKEGVSVVHNKDAI